MSSNTITPKELAQYIDHTLLKPESTKAQVRKICEEALEHHFYAVCVNSGMVSTCREILRNTKIQSPVLLAFR